MFQRTNSYLNNLVFTLIIILGIGTFVSACGSAQDDGLDLVVQTRDVPTPGTGRSEDSSGAYPSLPEGYPVPESNGETLPEGLMNELPGEIDLPAADPTSGIIGGVLVREFEGNQFFPVTPAALLLSQPIYGSSGNSVLFKIPEDAIRAELLPTGIFIFRNVPPGEYGIVIDLAVSQQPLEDENGQIVITVEAGQAYDLGPIVVD